MTAPSRAKVGETQLRAIASDIRYYPLFLMPNFEVPKSNYEAGEERRRVGTAYNALAGTSGPIRNMFAINGLPRVVRDVLA